MATDKNKWTACSLANRMYESQTEATSIQKPTLLSSKHTRYEGVYSFPLCLIGLLQRRAEGLKSAIKDQYV